MAPDRVHDTTNGSSTAKRPKVPVTVTSYTVADLQVATNSFCQDSLLGEGSLGRVYKAGFPNGKVRNRMFDLIIEHFELCLLYVSPVMHACL